MHSFVLQFLSCQIILGHIARTIQIKEYGERKFNSLLKIQIPRFRKQWSQSGEHRFSSIQGCPVHLNKLVKLLTMLIVLLCFLFSYFLCFLDDTNNGLANLFTNSGDPGSIRIWYRSSCATSTENDRHLDVYCIRTFKIIKQKRSE
jgi:hypothetical protein